MLASAATAAPHRTPIKPAKTYSAPLDAATGERSVRTLDARTPSVSLRFDLSQADVINRLDLRLSADPLPGVDPSLPLVVRFNGGEAVSIDTRGQGFDAVVSLDPMRARATGNILQLSHPLSCGASGGGYAVNLDASTLDVVARPKNRRLQLREVESRLSASAFAPRRVGLIATGDNATRLQALGAQAVGLRMQAIPDFTTTTAATDFTLVMVRADELSAYTREADILSGTGSRIALSRTHPDRLFLTGDTDAEVLQSVKAFARHYLPRSRRSDTTPGELGVQSPLDYDRTTVSGTVRLDGLSVTTGDLREYTFDVADPAATQGELVLRLTRDARTAPGARLKAVLNGESLGEARMDSRRKTVSYPIRAEQLRGSDNRLELTTKAAPGSDACTETPPFIAVGAGSRLRLSADRPSAPTDLSRLAADGSVFGRDAGARTEVVLPADEADFRAALRVVARLGEASGQGWTEARMSRGVANSDDRHLLVIEPFEQIEADIRAGAPRGLQSAWRGQPTNGDNRLASVERFAGLDADEAVRLAARQLRASGRISAGGVAAVYPGRGRLIGVVSNTPGIGFRNAIAPLSSAEHWNGLSGGVSRWNGRAVVMAQAATAAPDIAPAPLPDAGPGLWQRVANLELGAPEFDLPDVPLPSIDLDGVGRWLSERMPSRTITPESVPDSEPAPTAPAAPIATPEPKVAQALPRIPVRTAPVTAPSVKPARSLPPATALRLRGPIDLGAAQARPRMRGEWSLSSVRQRVRSAGQDAQSWLRRMEVKASRLRADLRSETGLRRPDVAGLRVGGYEIPPAILLLVLAAMLAVIGLFTVSSRSRT